MQWNKSDWINKINQNKSENLYFQIVFQYVEMGEARAPQTAVDDLSFSVTCAHDPDNSELPVTPEPTMTPATTSTPMTDAPPASPTLNPCKVRTFQL